MSGLGGTKGERREPMDGARPVREKWEHGSQKMRRAKRCARSQAGALLAQNRMRYCRYEAQADCMRLVCPAENCV